jgi:hypothetical protein
VYGLYGGTEIQGSAQELEPRGSLAASPAGSGPRVFEEVPSWSARSSGLRPEPWNLGLSTLQHSGRPSVPRSQPFRVARHSIFDTLYCEP